MFLPIALLVFIVRKDLRQEMIFTGSFVAILSWFLQFFYLNDYWNPPYLLAGKFLRIEDLAFGFVVGLFTAVIYEEISKRRLRKLNRPMPNKYNFVLILVTSLLGSLIIFTAIWGVNSIYSSYIGFLISSLYIWRKRSDLIFDSLISGMILVSVAIFYYIVIIYLFPDIVSNWLIAKNISGIFILGFPIEEILWYLIFGFLVGPLYEFWKSYKLIKN